MTHQEIMTQLHASLAERWRPEDVLDVALPLLRRELPVPAYAELAEASMPAAAWAGPVSGMSRGFARAHPGAAPIRRGRAGRRLRRRPGRN